MASDFSNKSPFDWPLYSVVLVTFANGKRRGASHSLNYIVDR